MHVNKKMDDIQKPIGTHVGGARQSSSCVGTRRRGISGVLVSLSMKLLALAASVDMMASGISVIDSE